MVGRFDERFLEEVKSRLRPSDVIGRTVKLRKQGREYVGLSPFNKEKTPSFYVNDDKGQFFDFSSGKTGDLITFLQETERLSFAEAVERLAAEAGVPLPAMDPRGQEQDKKRHELGDWLEMAAQWFEGELRRPAGRDARAYLERRGLPESEWSRFRLGFSPGGRTALKDYLVTKGARPPELIEAGLLIAPEDGGAAYDRFRDRIIFPILDVRGRVVSFGGRAMDPQARAKYLNGPETVVFHKGHQLYGLSEARKIIAAAPAGRSRRWWWSKAIWTSSPASGRACRRWPRWVRRWAKIRWRCCGATTRSPPSASTATGQGGRRRGGPSIGRCRC